MKWVGAWTPAPVALDIEDGRVAVTAGPASDLFVDPLSATMTDNATRSVIDAPTGDFQLVARVEVEFASTFDAGVLLVWVDATRWAKLCFERAPDGHPTVVSVVNRGTSDDANGPEVGEDGVWLRISRRADAYGLHFSTDGERWRMLRYFSLGKPAGPARLGLLAQSPTGPGCTVIFSALALTRTTLIDFRDGS
jgi:regulation of enolase protein 1 (concanavalin A-like superfamily)